MYENMKKQILIAFFISYAISLDLAAVNLRSVNSRNGLSSMFVFSLHQDSIGFIWAGTYNGVSILEGYNSSVAETGMSGLRRLSGSIVEEIQDGKEGHIWIHSNFAFCCWNISDGELSQFPEINGSYKFAVSPEDEVVVCSRERGLMYYNKKSDQFTPFSFQNLRYSEILYMHIDNRHRWIVVTHTHTIIVHIKEQEDGSLEFEAESEHAHPMGRLRYAKYNGGDMFYVTEGNQMFTSDLYGKKAQLQLTLSDNLISRGDVSAIVRHKKHFIIGFYSGGAFQLTPTTDGTKEESLGVTCGVFDIRRDIRQDIVWMATDGEGIQYYANEDYTLHNELFSQLPFVVSKPVRSLVKDKNGDMLMATKGDGIIIYRQYQPGQATTQIDHYQTSNSPLLHNNIYCLVQSPHGIIWIGSDGNGVNYYDPQTRQFGTLPIGNIPIGNIHDLTEVDNELWLATSGRGVFRLKLAWQDQYPTILESEQMLYDAESFSASQFLSACVMGGKVWFGNRENGLVCIDRKTLKSQRIYFNSMRQDAVNDVVNVTGVPGHGIICSTSGGIFFQPTKPDGSPGGDFVNTSDSLAFIAQPIRSTLTVGTNEVWGSAADFLFLSFPKKKSIKRFTNSDMLHVEEFVEGACFYDEATGTKYFGGTNGFVAVSPRLGNSTSFTPPLYFTCIVHSSEGEFNARLFFITKQMQLSHEQNYFSIRFTPIDYVEAEDYIFEYRMKSGKEHWTDYGHRREVTFTGLAPGKYTMQVRYRKGAYISPVYEAHFEILPPWWLSWPMVSLYWLIILAAIAYLIYRYIRRQRRRQQYMIERMNEQHREEVYESKLRFFTNITHEFSTPLTLISGPCQRILDMAGINPLIKDYASIIQHSSNRLNELIQQLIEYRRIDTGNRKMQISEINITTRLSEIVSTFTVESEKADIDYKADIQPDLKWPTDANAFTTIAINLISNAFKYVPDHGSIHIDMHETENNQLQLTVSNSGRGISQEQIDRMFNRYIILEDLENSKFARGFARNGLGLAITQGLVKGLNGKIDVEGELNQTTFTVVLPLLEINTETPAPATGYTAVHIAEDDIYPEQPAMAQSDAANKPNILVVDDDKEMVWFLTDVLREQYNILSFTNPEEAYLAFRQKRIDLVLSDVIMKPFDGIELCRRIKGDHTTSHIPVVLLSSSQSEDMRRITADAGAELFISKPFDLEYFRTIVRNQLKRNTMLKDYFNSTLSAFEVVDGKHLHHEDKVFLDRIYRIVDDNLRNPDLSTQFIAKEVGVGLRNLYRKLEDITDLTPKDMIREARLERARQLLTKTEMSMEEVCYEAGFGNRGTFYKLFAAKFGCTPKQYHDQMIAEAKGKLNKS